MRTLEFQESYDRAKLLAEQWFKKSHVREGLFNDPLDFEGQWKIFWKKMEEREPALIREASGAVDKHGLRFADGKATQKGVMAQAVWGEVMPELIKRAWSNNSCGDRQGRPLVSELLRGCGDEGLLLIRENWLEMWQRLTADCPFVKDSSEKRKGSMVSLCGGVEGESIAALWGVRPSLEESQKQADKLWMWARPDPTKMLESHSTRRDKLNDTNESIMWEEWWHIAAKLGMWGLPTWREVAAGVCHGWWVRATQKRLPDEEEWKVLGLYHCAKNARNKLIWAGQQSFPTKDYVEDALSDFKKNLEMFLPVVTTEITEKAIEKFANANNRGSAGSGQAVAKCIEMMNEFQRLVLQVHVELQMSGGENKIAVKSKIKSIL